MLLCLFFNTAMASVEPGLDVFFERGYQSDLRGKRIGLITNHTGVDKNLVSNIERFLAHQKDYKIEAIFSPEHGINGRSYAAEKVKNSKIGKITIHSLHGKTRRPTKEMLRDIDVLIYDMQCIGSRSYTYITTLFYAMEEASKHDIEVYVLDRPNPINGLIVDGPMLDPKWKSFIGYVNVPYCHGMTIGELATFFNEEHSVGCRLKVIPMRGWNRNMSYKDTGLAWIPPSPHIPEPDTPFFYPSTGILGELKLLNIGVGYTLPFKIVGAPWVDAKMFARHLNAQNLPGVNFIPFHYRPFYGMYKGKDCNGVMIRITNRRTYRPIAVQYLIIGMLKSLYPKMFTERLSASSKQKQLFSQANGTDKIFEILMKEQYPAWKLIEFQKKQRTKFLKLRERYLYPGYKVGK